MKHNCLTLSVITLFCFISHFSFAQNCGSWIAENKFVGNFQQIKTKSQTLVVRGNYSYAIEFMNDKKGVVAQVFSKNGVEFNQEDEIIFVDQASNRKSYRFVGMGEVVRQGGTPVYQNILQLDLAAISWFSSSIITTIYIKNNISNEMRKFTVNGSRQADFKSSITCFDNTLDKSKVNNTVLKGNDYTPRKAGSAGSKKNKPISSTSSGTRKVADISLLNDEELSSLKQKIGVCQ